MTRDQLVAMIEQGAAQGLVWPTNAVVLHLIHELPCPARQAGRGIADCGCRPAAYCYGPDRQTYLWDESASEWRVSPEPYPGVVPAHRFAFSPN